MHTRVVEQDGRARASRFMVLVMIGGLLLGSCSSGGDAGGTPPGTSLPPTLAPAPSESCRPPADGWIELPGGRRVLVRVPEGQPAEVSDRPAVVVLHGYRASPDHAESSSGWTPFLASQGAVAAYPEGSATPDGGFGWNTGSARFSTAGVDDIAFLGAVIDALVRDICVDRSRVALVGMSNGGALTLLAACDTRTATAFRSFAPVIPAVDDGVLARCGAGPALRFTALAGKLDETVRYDGIYPPGDTALLGQEEWFTKVVASRNQCTKKLERSRIDDAEVIATRDCTDGAVLVAIDDAIHTWPGGPAAPGDPDPGRFPATRYVWDRAGLD